MVSKGLREHDDQQFHEFGTGRRHWKITRHDGPDRRETASRIFSYGNGAQALLWIERYDDRRFSWQAGVSLPFSAGPEVSHNDRRFGPVRDWTIAYEEVLEAPLAVAKATARDAADRATRAIGRHNGWWIICQIFELDYGVTNDVMRDALYARIAPHFLAVAGR